MRWWDTAVLGTAATLGALLLVQTDEPWRIVTGAAGIALLVMAWIALGRRRGDDPRRAHWFVMLTVVASGIVVAAYPTLAIVQVIAYPIVWTYSSSMRRAVIANITVSLSVGLGFIVSLGSGADNLVQTAFTIALSLAFSLAMGFWISRMTRLGDGRGRLLAELQGAQEQIAALHRDSGAAAERDAEVVVLRCVQEALANSRKHARASRITIEVEAIGGGAHERDASGTAIEPAPAPRVRVTVSDDGIGFDPDLAPDGFGLTGMTERLALVRGTLSVSSTPGNGASIDAELPTAVTA